MNARAQRRWAAKLAPIFEDEYAAGGDEAAIQRRIRSRIKREYGSVSFVVLLLQVLPLLIELWKAIRK